MNVNTLGKTNQMTFNFVQLHFHWGYNDYQGKIKLLNNLD